MTTEDKKIMISRSSSEFNTHSLSFFFDQSLENQRTNEGNLQHTVYDILLVVLVSTLYGIEKYSLIVQFTKNELEWFKKYREFDNSIPYSETIRRFLIALTLRLFKNVISIRLVHCAAHQ